MSAREIDYNILADNAAQFADQQLADAAECVAVLLETQLPPQAEIMKKHPMLVVGFALLAHLDARAEERRLLTETRPESLLMATLLLDGQRPEVLYDALKAEYQRLNPYCSSEQHAAAMERFARLVGL